MNSSSTPRGCSAEGGSLGGVLKKFWGYEAFRPVQEQIIESVLAGRDTLALMPTGGGKSLTYQVPTLTREGLCIVVTPLIALMKDQVDRLRKLGINAVAVHSGLSAHQIDIALDNCVYGDVKFLYVAPERLTSQAFRLRVQRMNVSLLAVDEAHCICQWGYDFRPSYLRIAELRQLIPATPVLALTASATPEVAEDIMAKLLFPAPCIFRSSFARPNLSYIVRHTEEKNEQLLRVIRNVGGVGIVYVRTREGTEKIAAFLRDNGIEADFYHAGLTYSERAIKQESWLAERTPVMVATNAFGMGIDKANVRYVIHCAPCDSIEAYYQEAGRAGRDGQRSYAVLLHSPDDGPRIQQRFEIEFPPLETVKSIYDKVGSFLQVAIGDGEQTAHPFNMVEFCRREKVYEGTVVKALKLLQQNGYMTLTDANENPPRMMFCVSRDELYKFRVIQGDLDQFLRIVLRLYEGLFSDFQPIDIGEIASWSGYTGERVNEFLKRLWQLRIIRYIPSNRAPILYFETERLPVESLYISPESYRLRREIHEAQFSKMLEYAENVTECRSVFLDRYFNGDDTKATPCGVCDVCIAKKKSSTHDLETQILDLLSKENSDAKQIVSQIVGDSDRIAKLLITLRDAGKIRMDKNGKISLSSSSE